MAHIIYEYEIPDPDRPRVVTDDFDFGPSGELIRFFPPPLNAAAILGQRVQKISTSVGTYGMGGPGFFGLGLESEWIVVAVWGAAEWILVNGRLIHDTFHLNHSRPQPWDTEDLSVLLIGTTIKYLDVRHTSLAIQFDSGAILEIDDGPERRPILEGSKQPRVFAADDDLRRAVFLAPTTEIWV